MSQPRTNLVPSGARRAVDAAQVVQRRTDKGLTQAQLAEDAGISRPYVALIERGHRRIVTADVLDALASALGCQASDIGTAEADGQQWHTTAEAAAILRLHPETLRTLIRAGDVRAKTLGSRYRISSREIDRLLSAAAADEQVSA